MYSVFSLLFEVILLDPLHQIYELGVVPYYVGQVASRKGSGQYGEKMAENQSVQFSGSTNTYNITKNY